MAWETRGGKRYYYRKVKVGHQVRSIYVGSEETAGDLIRQFEERRRQEAARQAEFQRRKSELEAAWRPMMLAIEKIDLVMAGVLMSEGYHQSTKNAPWRLRRGKAKTAS